jgi:hypothetical protein
MTLRRSTQSLLLQARALGPTSTITAPSLYLTRKYHPTSSLTSGNKEPLKDREALNPRRSEGTKSGYDDEVAEKSDAAYNPKKTDPKEEKNSAQGNGNPLEVSGANQEFSRPQNPEEASDKTDKKTRSTASKQKKHGKVAPM